MVVSITLDDLEKNAGSTPAMLPALPRILANALVDKAIR
jgi:hypothetical protein